ncbi:MAG: hypothetical protein ACJAT6_001435 [Akkermansiaceae bacterium]|jgi:hypothetical protein|tara:strand:- start:116 stop:778 length:663 start_codon:yes stop_codon:yes gene_type:complete
MDFESTLLEKQLKELIPISLPESLLTRLDIAMASASDEVATPEEKVIVASSDTELTALEEGLRGLVPYGAPENIISRLDEAMSRWHEEVPVEEKIVSIAPQPERQTSSWLGFRSVAAVGLLGVGVAFITSGRPQSPIVQSQKIPDLTNGNTAPAVFTPKDARASVVSANDRGVIWTKSGQPVRCLEVHVNNKVQFVNERGDKLIVEQPKREVRFTPIPVD